jgi:hypothetical protein
MVDGPQPLEKPAEIPDRGRAGRGRGAVGKERDGEDEWKKNREGPEFPERGYSFLSRTGHGVPPSAEARDFTSGRILRHEAGADQSPAAGFPALTGA